MLATLQVFITFRHQHFVLLAANLVNGLAEMLGNMKFIEGNLLLRIRKALQCRIDIFVGVGTTAVIYGTVVGLAQRQCRSLLAYSSMSQMGLMTLGVGIGIGSPDNWSTVQGVLLLFALHHALAKGALFHGMGVRGKSQLGLWLPALALAGLPFTGGALAKGLLKTQVMLIPAPWSMIAAWMIVLGSAGTTLLMARFLYLAFKAGLAPEPELAAPATWWLLVVAMLLLPWVIHIEPGRIDLVRGSLWPVLLGVSVAWFVYRGGFARILSVVPPVPPGDLLVYIEKLINRFRSHAVHSGHAVEYEVMPGRHVVPGLLAARERILGRWLVAGILLLVLLVGIVLLLARFN